MINHGEKGSVGGDLDSINKIIRIVAISLLTLCALYGYYNRNDKSLASYRHSINANKGATTDKLSKTEELTTEKLDKVDPVVHFAPLYSAYNIPPFDPAIYEIEGMRYQLDILKRETCNRYALYKVSQKLSANSLNREAISFIKGFSSKCPDSEGDLLHAANLAYGLSNYQDALDLTNQVIHKNPSANLAIYLKARTLQKLDRHTDALSAYIDVIKSMPNQSLIKPEVFSDLASSYASIGKYCEAASAIQTYVAFDYEERMNNTYRDEISNYEKQGDCISGYASGTSETLYQKNGSIIATVTINGVQGRFIVDTGASLVSVTPSFTVKAKLNKIEGDIVETSTANGESKALLVSFKEVALGNLHAQKVPALLMDKNLPNGVDGLLGLSFLSRFNLSTEGKRMVISPLKVSATTDINTSE